VHRLDKAVSGVVLFARTGKALSRLNASMRERQFVKIYHAVVEGRPARTSGVLKHQLRHGSHRAEVVTAGTRGAKKAILEYRLVRTKQMCSLLEITLHTGRYHQIRAQLAVSGMPVLGDRRYGGAGGGLPRDMIALHHRHMEVTHPVRKEQVRIKAGYPPHWPRV
jgi:23S rRNA pseudouridine1911/1915/1917 synthase